MGSLTRTQITISPILLPKRHALKNQHITLHSRKMPKYSRTTSRSLPSHHADRLPGFKQHILLLERLRINQILRVARSDEEDITVFRLRVLHRCDVF